MKFGVRVPNTGPLAYADNLVTIVQRAEDLGFNAVSVQGHIEWGLSESYHFSCGSAEAVEQAEERSRSRCYEAMTTLSFLAGKTNKLRLTTSALPLPWMQPVLLAKEVSTLCELSHGRFFPSLCIGNHMKDFEAMGVSSRDRGKIYDEYLAVLSKILTSDPPTDFEGKYVKFKSASFLPKVQVPIWIVGRLAEGPAIERVSKYGSGWLTSGSPDSYRKIADKLRAMSDERAKRGLGGVELGCAKWISIAKNAETAIQDSSYTFERFHQSNLEMYGKSGVRPPTHPSKTALIGDPTAISERIKSYQGAGTDYVELRFVCHSVGDLLSKMELFSSEVLPDFA